MQLVQAKPKPVVMQPAHPRQRIRCLGRQMTYLRISLTDRCNLRCVNCMPAQGMFFQPREELLTDDELSGWSACSRARVSRNSG